MVAFDLAELNLLGLDFLAQFVPELWFKILVQVIIAEVQRGMASRNYVTGCHDIIKTR